MYSKFLTKVSKLALPIMIGGGALLLSSLPVEACRGADGYPQAFKKLEMSQIPDTLKKQIRAELTKGKAIHDQGHNDDDNDKKRESLKILDGVNKKIK
jgi:hypothetical protein